MKLTGYYTKAGEQIAAGLLAGKTLSVARITAGAGSTSTSAATLDQEKQDLGPCAPEVSGTTAVIRCTLTSTQAKEPYFLRELGVYALDETGQQVLYLIFRLDEEVSIHPSFRLVLRFNLEQTLSDGAGVKVTAPLTGVATQEELKAKADLVGGQVPYAQTPHVAAVKTVYVDAKNGDDSNQGSAEKPFKTIQAAVDSMPRDLGQSGVYISVAEGTYDEDVVVNGFYGGKTGRGIDITGSANRENISAYQVRSITASNNSTFVKVSGFLITGAASTASVVVSGSILGMLDCTIQKAEDTNVDTGVAVGAGVPAQVKMIRCTVDGYPGSGVLVDGAAVLSFADGTIKNCAKGLVAGSLTSRTGGAATYYSTTFQGNTTDRAVAAGGQIFTTGGFAS